MKACLFLAILCGVQAQPAQLGRISFPTSGPPVAQKYFLRGVLLLHSFEYLDARGAFQAAQKVAPGFAMAYWGEAMTYNEPVWFAQDLRAARAALNRLAPTPEARRAKTRAEREKAYLEAVDILYGEGHKEKRDFEYAAAMRRLHETYPDDQDAAAFYALSLLGTSHNGRDFRTYMQAAAIVEDVLSKIAEHPGALHYLIHCYDDPIHAPLGLRAARIYAKIAPDAAHALHMPSHIFFALGMWDEAASSNEAAWKASKDKHGGAYHALWWLQYAYLQQGRFADARRILQLMEQHAAAQPSALLRFHLVQMRAMYSIETGEPIKTDIERSGLELSAIGAHLLATGISALNHGKRDEADRSLDDLRTFGHSAVLEIMQNELAALLLMADGKSKEAIELMKKAIAIEDKTAFEFGPPSPPKPAHELLGELLLQLGQPMLARVQFELALVRYPNRALSLLGLARSFSQADDKTAARQTHAQLRKIWSRADPELLKALNSGDQN